MPSRRTITGECGRGCGKAMVAAYRAHRGYPATAKNVHRIARKAALERMVSQRRETHQNKGGPMTTQSGDEGTS